MGISVQALKAMLVENEYKPLYGDVLIIGRSTVCVPEITIEALLKDFGLGEVPLKLLKLRETTTKHQTDDYCIDDRLLIRALS